MSAAFVIALLPNAGHSSWELALAVMASVFVLVGLYWLIAALIPIWPFRSVQLPASGASPGTSIRADGGTTVAPGAAADSGTHVGARRVIRPMSRKTYLRLIGSDDRARL